MARGRWLLRGHQALGHIASGAALLAGGVMLAAPAMAGGFWLYEMGTPDLGTAGGGPGGARQGRGDGVRQSRPA